MSIFFSSKSLGFLLLRSPELMSVCNRKVKLGDDVGCWHGGIWNEEEVSSMKTTEKIKTILSTYETKNVKWRATRMHGREEKPEPGTWSVVYKEISKLHTFHLYTAVGCRKMVKLDPVQKQIKSSPYTECDVNSARNDWMVRWPQLMDLTRSGVWEKAGGEIHGVAVDILDSRSRWMTKHVRFRVVFLKEHSKTIYALPSTSPLSATTTTTDKFLTFQNITVELERYLICFQMK